MSADQSNRQARKASLLEIDENLAGERQRNDETRFERTIRRLVAGLVHDVLAAVAGASAADVGELFQSGAPRQGREGRLPQVAPQVAPQAAAQEVGATARQHDARAATPSGPFDITSPGELLASTDERPSPPPSEHALPSQPAEGSSPASPEGERPAPSERRPTVVLREGEHLLNAIGSGVVIRRERRNR